MTDIASINIDAKDLLSNLTLKIHVPKTLRFRLALAIALARLTAWVGGMEFQAMVEEATTKPSLDDLRKANIAAQDHLSELLKRPKAWRP